MSAPDAPSTLSRRAEAALERLGDHRSLWFEGTWSTSGELAGRARRAAAGFVRLGVRPGDRVVLVMANCPEVGIACTALWRAGAVATPVLFLLSEDELRHVMTDSGAVAVVTTPDFLPKVRASESQYSDTANTRSKWANRASPGPSARLRRNMSTSGAR